jgi:hypothetical protein
MGDTVNYWKVKNNIINHENSEYIYTYIGKFPMSDIRNKAKELYEQYKNEWTGILLKIVRVDAWDRTKNYYYLYYNGRKFIKNPDFIYFDNADILDHYNLHKYYN